MKLLDLSTYDNYSTVPWITRLKKRACFKSMFGYSFWCALFICLTVFVYWIFVKTFQSISFFKPPSKRHEIWSVYLAERCLRTPKNEEVHKSLSSEISCPKFEKNSPWDLLRYYDFAGTCLFFCSILEGISKKDWRYYCVYRWTISLTRLLSSRFLWFPVS